MERKFFSGLGNKNGILTSVGEGRHRKKELGMERWLSWMQAQGPCAPSPP